MFGSDSNATREVLFRAPSRWPSTILLLLTVFLGTSLVALYLAPDWAVRWRRADDQAAAEAAYLKRQAELKAEAEAAGQRIEQMDRRIHFVSLGFREVARKVAPVVVHIGNEVEVPDVPARGRTFYDFDSNRHYQERAEGSGILVKPGYVLTNEHVVHNAELLRITFASGRSVMADPAKVSADKMTDLAVIRLPEDSSIALKEDYAAEAQFADSDKDVQVGDWVLAAGSPFGLKQTITAGIISAKGRVELGILDQVELIQTDAAVNPGNSGGPLFDQLGRVIGINVAIASPTGVNGGIAFAIPSNTAKEIFDQLVEKGEVIRGYLGIRMQDVPAGLEQRLGIQETGGVIVTEVVRGSPAYEAGIQRHDLIIRVGGEAVGMVNSMNHLRRSITKTPPGSKLSIEVLRNQERLTLRPTIVKHEGIEPLRRPLLRQQE
jgi:S1-C subfamily serine protease